MGDTGSLALGGFVGRYGLCDADAVIYPDRGSDLSDRSTFRYHSGNLFQGNTWKAYFLRWRRSIIIFELCGWSETRVVAVFSVITAVMCMVALLAL